MTSQHFDDGWDTNWGEDWGGNYNESNNNTHHNSSQQLSQQNQQYASQQQTPLQPSQQSQINAPIFSPFSYQQPPHIQHSTASSVTTQRSQPNPFAKTQAQHNQQQQYGNPVNFFNPTQFSDANSINNNNVSQYASNQPSSYSFVQSPIPTSTITTSLNPHSVQFEKAKFENFQHHQDVNRRDGSATNIKPVQYSMPPSSYSNDQNSAPTLPMQQSIYNTNLANQPRNVATPPALIQNFDNNFNSTSMATQQQSTQYQYSPQPQWGDQRSQSNESANNALNWNHQQQQPIPSPSNQNSFNMISNQQQQGAIISSSNTEWQNTQTPVVSSSSNPAMPSSSTPFFSSQTQFGTPPPIKEERSVTQGLPEISQSAGATHNINKPYVLPQSPKYENLENVQTPISEPVSVPQMQPQANPSPLFNTATPPKNPPFVSEIPYPENRERLDDLSLPPLPQPQVSQSLPAPISSSTSSIDRHNYLVTGQLSQEFSVFNSFNSQQQQNVLNESFNENLPPVRQLPLGEPENNQEQVLHPPPQSELLPPRSNRMVTGNEMTPTSFMNYQRQADGEVSHEPSIALPPFSTATVGQQQSQQQSQQHHVPESSHQQNFNISDRNLYLVAGESDANSQRVITGVESDNIAPMNIINPLQNLHIEDDEDFVNISVTQMSRNVDGDGMEEQFIQQQQIQHNQIQQSLNSSQQREEDIEGANDNNAESNISAQQIANPIEIPPIPQSLNEQQNSDVREDIEGGNDSGEDVPKAQPVELEEKRKSIDSGVRSQHKQNITLSSEDSELRELEKNMKSRARRNKKYDDSNDSESASLDEYKNKSRDKYDDRYGSKRNRDRIRDEYEKYKKKEKERRSGGRSKRNDDTDGSRYDSKRRTDDEDDDRRRNRNRNRDRRSDEAKDGDERDRNDKKQRDHREHRDSRRKDYEYDDRRRERRRRDKYYEDEVYASGRRSHNTSDKEFYGEYRQGRSSRGAYDGYYQQPYPYDPNYYQMYQQQQYSDKLANWLEQIRLTNPQAYEWYKTYYAGMLQKPQIQPQPAMDDIGGSLRSGYNSSSERASTSRFISGGIVTNPLRSLNSSFIDNTNEYQSLQPSYQAIGKDFNQAYSSLNYSNSFDIYGDSRAKHPEVVASRMTPQKFQCLHGFVRMANGLMITVDTINTDEKYSVRIENVPIFDKTRRLYQFYPGPLIRGTSHKKTVIEFCEDKLKQNSQIEHSMRSSYALLWSYLILMIRQNGSYTEHDIAELLMKNSEEYRLYDVEDAVDENATDVSESADENVISEHNSNSVSHQSRQTTQSTASGSVLTEQVVLDKFKNYLLYGNIHDALDYATDNNLWGHALFLASKVDRRQHANVMLKFANKLSYNDPLQTLYQIMSGRMPACVTNFDDKWGDWRPHLAMIISNCSDKPDLVKRSILALGDTLASRGDIYGSQFCYLLIDPQFTDYSDSSMTNGKIALLGTTVQKPFNEFASNDSIIMTEVYEYARSLNSENYFITSLQNYKFLLATNMLDYGLQLKCLLYMEQISKCIIQQPELFESSFISKVYSLADRLKFYDPVMEKLYEDNANNVNEETEDQKWLQDLSMVVQSQNDSVVSEQYIPPPIPTYSSSSNDVYNPINYQQTTPIYDPVSAHQTPTHVPTIPSSQTYEDIDSNQYNGSNNGYEQQHQVPTYDQNAAYNQYQNQMQNNYYGQNTSLPNEGQNIIHKNEQLQQNQPQNFIQPSFDMNSQYQQNDYANSYQWEQGKPNITMGTAVSQKFDDPLTQEKPEVETNQKEEKKSPTKKPEPEKAKKAAQGGGSWISSIFKFGKAPNQMILPDDKNPTIVWDEATKKWVNKDEDPSEAESFKPPPKMGEIPQQPMQIPQPTVQQQQQFIPQTQQPMMSQQPLMNQNPTQMQSNVAHLSHLQQQPQQMVQNTTEEVIPSAPNMFKMQRGRNLKKSYVDILGNAGKTVSQPKELAPQMDMQFLNPAVQPQGMQFYNPNDFQ